MPHWRTLFHLVLPKSIVFANLEKYCRTAGNDTEADEVYVCRRLYEVERLPRNVRSFGFVLREFGYLNYHIIRFGKKPWDALWLCFAIVLFGAFVFAPDAMRLAADAQTTDQLVGPWYSRF